jgi:hypothetical protein
MIERENYLGMDWAVILFILIISGLLITGITKNLLTRFATRFLIGVLVLGIIIYIGLRLGK